MPGHRRRQGGDLEHRAPEPVLELGPRAVRVGDAEHGRECDTLLDPEPTDHLGGDLGPERGLVEGAREAERVDVGAPLGHEVELHAARLYAGAREHVRGQRRVEVLERAEADDADRRHRAAGRRRPSSPGRPRTGAATPTAVGSRRFSSRPPV